MIAVTLLASGAMVAACGNGGQQSLGRLLPSATGTPTPTVTQSATPVVNATSSPGKVHGTGTYILDHDGVVASLRLPPDASQEDVTRLRDLIRRTHAPALQLASVTVTAK